MLDQRFVEYTFMCRVDQNRIYIRYMNIFI